MKIKGLAIVSFVAIMVIAALLLSCVHTPSEANTIAPTDLGKQAPERIITPEKPANIGSYEELGRLAEKDPAEIDNSELPITPTDRLGVTGFAPDVEISQYRLTIDGAVDKPLSLTYEEILRYPSVTQTVLLICSLTFVDNAQWTGVPLKTLLTEAGVKSQAKQVYIYALDGYSDTLSLADANRDGTFLAYQVNGETLPEKHGYPLRLVVEGKLGHYWAGLYEYRGRTQKDLCVSWFRR